MAYVCQIQMTIDMLPIKPQMAAILDLFFNETLKVTNSFRNEFSIKKEAIKEDTLVMYRCKKVICNSNTNDNSLALNQTSNGGHLCFIL